MSADGFVLIHGGCSTGAIWRRLAARLDGPVLAVDLPGRREPERLAQACFDSWADAVLARMDEAKIACAIVVAHSMGGGVLAALTRKAPERVALAVFFSAVVPPDGGLFLEGLNARQQLYMRDFRDAGATTLPRLDGAAFNEGEDDLDWGSEEALAPFFERVSLAGLARTRRAFVRLARDSSIEPERQDLFIARLRAFGDCAVRTVDAGHLAMITAPEASAAALISLRDEYT
jgi:pimeloyl-ACP methyl ester carboxylesterase